MSKTTPEEALQRATKHRINLMYSSDFVKLAALIDEVRGVDAEPVTPSTLTDTQLAAAAYDGYDEYWTEDSRGIQTEAWAASAKAVLALAASAPAQQSETPEGYKLVMVPDEEAPDEPDWEECKRQAELAIGLKVELHTFSILKREVRRWIAHKSTQSQPAAPVELPVVATENLTFAVLERHHRTRMNGNFKLVPVPPGQSLEMDKDGATRRWLHPYLGTDFHLVEFIKLSDAQAAIAAGRKAS